MKTNLLLITVLLFAISCAKEPSAENNQSGADVEYTSMTFKATAEDVTKVLLQNDRVSLHWQAADRIKVFDGVSNDLPAFAASGSGAQVDFHGQVVNSEGPFYALYPYQNDARMEDGTLYANVPEIQHAVAGSVPSDAFIAVARESDGQLIFRTMLGYIRFTLNDNNAANIVSLTLSGNNGEYITGGLKITFDADDVPVDDYVADKAHAYATLVGSFENGKDYIFAVREQQFTKGVTISVLYKDGTHRYISGAADFLDQNGQSIDFRPGMVLNISTLAVAEMKTTRPTDRYLAYLHGYDLEIAGETYNLTKNGSPTLVKAADGAGSVDIHTAINRKQGMVFCDSSEGECTLNSIADINGGGTRGYCRSI